MPGFLLTIEGIEGTGKTTFAHRIVDFLHNRNIQCVYAREPGGTAAGEALRDILLNGDVSLSPEGELLLMEAARVQLMNETVLPALETGKTVVLDRYIDSTTAYQGYGRGIDLEFVSRLNLFAGKNRLPDLTLLLDIDVPTGLSRARNIPTQNGFTDRFESEEFLFLERARQGFLDIAARNTDRIVVIEIDGDIETVWNKIRRILEEKYNFPTQ